jgi:DinB superfamily
MQDAKQYIEKTRDALVAATEGLPEAQCYFKPAPENWSIAEILEHLAMTQELILGPVRERLATAPPAPAGHPREQVDALILKAFPDRSNKFKGPEILMPKGQSTPSESLSRFKETCVRLTGYLESTPDLREHAVESLPLKALSNGTFQFIDGYQLVLAMAAHTERHTLQILELKADPDFPGAGDRRASVA